MEWFQKYQSERKSEGEGEDEGVQDRLPVVLEDDALASFLTLFLDWVTQGREKPVKDELFSDIPITRLTAALLSTPPSIISQLLQHMLDKEYVLSCRFVAGGRRRECRMSTRKLIRVLLKVGC